MSIGLDAPILPTSPNHEDWIKKALRLADKAFSEGEVPVGAVIVKDNKIIDWDFPEYEELRVFHNCEKKPKYKLESVANRRAAKRKFIMFFHCFSKIFHVPLTFHIQKFVFYVRNFFKSYII